MARRERLTNRKSLPGLLALALLLLLVNGPAVATTPSPTAPSSSPAAESGPTTSPAGNFQLEAENIEHDLDAGILMASGGVEVRLADMEVRGEQLQVDLDAHALAMSGPVLVATPSGAVQGDDLNYAWDQKTGTLRNAQFASEGVRFSSREADLAAGSWILHDGLLTKCVYPTPEYALQAKEITVDSEQQVATIRGGSLALFGLTILPLPDLRLSLQDTKVGRASRGNLPVPELGYTSERGYFLAQRFPVYLSDHALVLAQAGYGSEEKARLGLSGLYAPSTAGTYRWALVYQQHPPVADGLVRAEAAPDVHGTVDYELDGTAGRLKLGIEKKDDDDRRNLTFLPRVELTPRPVTLAGITLAPTLEWAGIREEASGEETTRTLAGLSWSASPQLGLPFTVTLSGAGKQAWYGTGDALTANTLSAAATQPVTETLRLEAKVNVQQTAGRTPLAFDRPDRYSEGEIGLSWQSGESRIASAAVYDLAGWGTADGTQALPGQPAALKAIASLSTERWRAEADVRYELGAAPHFSTAEVKVSRLLHCFEVALAVEPLDERLSFGVVFR